MITETTEKKVATKVKILTGVQVICSPDSYVGRWARTEEQRAKEFEAWAKEFNEFLRDHRHRDSTSVSVERQIEECCSACKSPWEPITDEGIEYCAHCGTETDK